MSYNVDDVVETIGNMGADTEEYVCVQMGYGQAETRNNIESGSGSSNYEYETFKRRKCRECSDFCVIL